jgi:phospholipase C
VHGPNGFLRVFQDAAPYSSMRVESRYDAAIQELVLILRNSGTMIRGILIRPLAYTNAPTRRRSLAPAEMMEDRWPIGTSNHWYDIELRSGFLVWRLAGHIETGRTSRSDPALG